MRSATLLALLPLAMAAPAKRATAAPLIAPRGAQTIEGKYIVKMKDQTTAAVKSSAISSIKADADYTYNTSKFNGFAATLTPEELESLRNHADVDYIEQDAVITIKATQSDAPWGIARLSNKEPGSTTYSYDESAGEGTCAYIIDTGIQTDHPEFEGRAEWLENTSGDGDDTDGAGHGTHVAGTVGSKTYGVAKKTSLFAIKVLDSSGSGSNAGVIAGMDFAVTDSKSRADKCPKGFVANMSLGGSSSDSVNAAAASVIDAGIFLAVAAGNEAADASTSSPASESSVCTVAASDDSDTFADFSNFGKGVDVVAPGVDILSTWPGSSTDTISGTSMASPHIAGLGAYLLGLGSAPTDPKELCAYIAENAVSDALSSVPSGTVNLIANNGFSA